MDFKDKVREYFKTKNIAVGRIEQDGDVESIACHIMPEDNSKVDECISEMEKELNVAVMRSDSFGMNVVIVESNNLEA